MQVNISRQLVGSHDWQQPVLASNVFMLPGRVSSVCTRRYVTRLRATVIGYFKKVNLCIFPTEDECSRAGCVDHSWRCIVSLAVYTHNFNARVHVLRASPFSIATSDGACVRLR